MFFYSTHYNTNECITQVLWWDIRKLGEPTEKLILDPTRKMNIDAAMGGIALEYEPTMVMIIFMSS